MQFVKRMSDENNRLSKKEIEETVCRKFRLSKQDIGICLGEMQQTGFLKTSKNHRAFNRRVLFPNH